MELKIIIPTNIWEFQPIIANWHQGLRMLMTFGHNLHIETLFEQGEAPSGRNVRQKYTDEFAGKDCYVHFLDCDNLIPIDPLQKLLRFASKTPPKIFMFGQIWHACGIKRLNAHPDNCLPARCDIAQLFVHGLFLKDMVWSADYENDGQFIQELYRRYPNDFVFINDVNVWYNCLRPNSTLYNGQIITIA
jgi:hypothetical protein